MESFRNKSQNLEPTLLGHLSVLGFGDTALQWLLSFMTEVQKVLHLVVPLAYSASRGSLCLAPHVIQHLHETAGRGNLTIWDFMLPVSSQYPALLFHPI